jgi:hypothetical protein
MVLRQRHAPVQAKTGPVDDKTGFLGDSIYVHKGVSGILPRTHSNVGVIHDMTVLDALAFVLQFRGHSHFIHERGAADFNVPGKIATLLDNGIARRQFSLEN